MRKPANSITQKSFHWNTQDKRNIATRVRDKKCKGKTRKELHEVETGRKDWLSWLKAYVPMRGEKTREERKIFIFKSLNPPFCFCSESPTVTSIQNNRYSK